MLLAVVIGLLCGAVLPLCWVALFCDVFVLLMCGVVFCVCVCGNAVYGVSFCLSVCVCVVPRCCSLCCYALVCVWLEFVWCLFCVGFALMNVDWVSW